MKGVVKKHLCSPASSCLAVVKKLLSTSKRERGISKEDYTKPLQATWIIPWHLSLLRAPSKKGLESICRRVNAFSVGWCSQTGRDMLLLLMVVLWSIEGVFHLQGLKGYPFSKGSRLMMDIFEILGWIFAGVNCQCSTKPGGFPADLTLVPRNCLGAQFWAWQIEWWLLGPSVKKYFKFSQFIIFPRARQKLRADFQPGGWLKLQHL